MSQNVQYFSQLEVAGLWQQEMKPYQNLVILNIAWH